MTTNPCFPQFNAQKQVNINFFSYLCKLLETRKMSLT